jgi:hypothetical protein
MDSPSAESGQVPPIKSWLGYVFAGICSLLFLAAVFLGVGAILHPGAAELGGLFGVILLVFVALPLLVATLLSYFLGHWLQRTYVRLRLAHPSKALWFAATAFLILAAFAYFFTATVSRFIELRVGG